MSGVIYVLENKHIPNLLKIGYTTQDVVERVKELSRATGVPYPFVCIYALEVGEDHYKGIEKDMHETFAKSRTHPKKEFFEVDPAQVIAALRPLLRVGAGKDVTPREDVVNDDVERESLSIDRERERRRPFKFSMVGIAPGTTLKFLYDDSETCEVLDNKLILFRGEKSSLSKAALLLLKEKGYTWTQCAGPQFWTHDGTTLAGIRKKKEKENEIESSG